MYAIRSYYGQVVDTVGFAHLAWQVDSINQRISSHFQDQLDQVEQETQTSWRAAICPHDDYTSYNFV